MKDRRNAARQFRYEAADVAYNRPHPPHRSNGEEGRLRLFKVVTPADEKKEDIGYFPSYIGAFTKGFAHNDYGFLRHPEADDYAAFIRACDAGDLASIQALKLNDPTQPGYGWLSRIAIDENVPIRGWESMGAGLVFDLEGPDAQSLTIPPAPTLGSDELTAEMLELYWMALCRDIPFTDFDGGINPNKQTIDDAIADLNSLPWFKDRNTYGLHPYEQARKRGYFKNAADKKAFDDATIFRGNVKGDDIGQYISQFLYVGNKALDAKTVAMPLFSPEAGRIGYGSMTAEQRVRIATKKLDYMTNWKQWLDVQNGADLRHLETYVGTDITNGYRFIWTPRDLCTYVHYDALHQAYFNACLILLGIDAPFDPNLPFRLPDSIDKQTGFAQFGPPHILNLVSEVATRALKAVRFQKYNVHRRTRPEVAGGWIHLFATYANTNPANRADIANEKIPDVSRTLDAIKETVDILKTKKVWKKVRDYNALQNSKDDRVADGYASTDSYLLPMPYVEGSPMHPSYGSGHATVAGACVTILKAFFDEGYVLPFAYKPISDGGALAVDVPNKGKLTVENELNKLAANIAFGRDWAGVHYWSDQIESLRLGEQIALGILEEQKLQYGENFSMTVPLFDGTSVRI